MVPLYALYALLFADAGISDAQISALFAIWSVAGILAEVPSGALADRWSRRSVLALSGLVTAAGYASWAMLPGFAGFAAGFVLWGVGGSMVSGAFEALLYDGLTAAGAADRFAQVLGWVQSASLVAQIPGAAAATVLFVAGGYAAVAWASVAWCLVVALAALLLPEPPRTGLDPPDPGDEIPGPDASDDLSYWQTLRRGVAEAARRPVVRVAALTVAAVAGVDAFEEYIPLIAADWGVPVAAIPAAGVGITLLGALGAAAAGSVNRLGAGALTAVYAAGVAAVAVGALLAVPIGLLGVALFYGLHQSVLVVSQTRLQQAISGPARATVTSVAALVTELMALVVFAAWAIGGLWWVIAVCAVVIPVLPRGLRAAGDPRPGPEEISPDRGAATH